MAKYSWKPGKVGKYRVREQVQGQNSAVRQVRVVPGNTGSRGTLFTAPSPAKTTVTLGRSVRVNGGGCWNSRVQGPGKKWAMKLRYRKAGTSTWKYAKTDRPSRARTACTKRGYPLRTSYRWKPPAAGKYVLQERTPWGTDSKVSRTITVKKDLANSRCKFKKSGPYGVKLVKGSCDTRVSPGRFGALSMGKTSVSTAKRLRYVYWDSGCRTLKSYLSGTERPGLGLPGWKDHWWSAVTSARPRVCARPTR